MAEKEYLAVLSVDDKILKEVEGGSIENALGWCLDSGVTLVSCKEIPTILTLPRVGDLETCLIDRYTLCVSNGMYIFDGDLEELFDHSKIVIKETKKIADWKYDSDGIITGAKEGELIEVAVLEQNGNLFECNVYAQNGGCGLDYAMDLNNIKQVICYSMNVHKSNGLEKEQHTVAHIWKDIVKVNGKIYAEEHPISGQKDGNGDEEYYQLDDFIAAVSQKHGVNADEIQTYMMDNIEFDPVNLPYGAEDCGCYINGVAEWTIGKQKEEKLKSYIIKSFEEECGMELFTLLVPVSVSKENVMGALEMAKEYARHCYDYIDEEYVNDYDEYFEKMNSASMENAQETFNYYLEKCRGWKIKPLKADFEYEW